MGFLRIALVVAAFSLAGCASSRRDAVEIDGRPALVRFHDDEVDVELPAGGPDARLDADRIDARLIARGGREVKRAWRVHGIVAPFCTNRFGGELHVCALFERDDIVAFAVAIGGEPSLFEVPGPE